MITTHYCPQCGAANEETSLRCFSCGQELKDDRGNDSAEVGKLLNGRYSLEAIVGSGGFSVVYRALDTQAGKRAVAVKQINLQGRSPEEVIEATDTFNREVALLAELDHPQIPQLFDSFGDREHWYLVLEFLEGETLESRLEHYATRHKPISLEETLSIGQQLCTVLDYLHTRQPPVIFRDLKPGNILRTPGGKLYLIDFGIARRYQPGKAQDTQRLGSPGYAAPEQYGRAQTTSQADIYSLGAILHQLLTGDDPSERPRGVAPRLPASIPGNAELITLIQTMLSPNPFERPRSVRDVSQALENIQQNQRTLYQAGQIWRPSIPQPLPQNTASSTATQFHLHASASPAQPAAVPRRRLSRRRVMAGLGVAGVAAAGFGVWQIGNSKELFPLFSASQPSSPPPYIYIYPGHRKAVTGVAWSPDGKRVASCSLDKTVQIWYKMDEGLNVMYTRHTGVVNDVAWSPDGERIASCSGDKTVQVYNSRAFTTADNILVYREHTAPVNSVAWSSSQVIASGSDDGTVQIWNSITKEKIFIYRAHEAPVRGVAWSPNSIFIASVDQKGILSIWHALPDMGNPPEKYQAHEGPVNDVTWSPDGTLVATCGEDATVKVWEKDEGLLYTYDKHANPVHGVAWSPDGKWIASCGNDSTVHVWDLNGKSLKEYFNHKNAVNKVAWSPDGKYIASGSDDLTAQVWSVFF